MILLHKDRRGDFSMTKMANADVVLRDISSVTVFCFSKKYSPIIEFSGNIDSALLQLENIDEVINTSLLLLCNKTIITEDKYHA
jgi:hypothetical protein